MLENLKHYIYTYLFTYPDDNSPFRVVSSLLLNGGRDNKELFREEFYFQDSPSPVFFFTNDAEFNRKKLIESYPDFFKRYESEIVPFVDERYPDLKDADLTSEDYWASLINELITEKENDPSMLSYARNQPTMFSMSFPHANSEIKITHNLFYSVYNRVNRYSDVASETELLEFTKKFFSTMVKTYRERIEQSTILAGPIKEAMRIKIYNFGVFHAKMFCLKMPEELEDTRPYTKEELAQHELWAIEFEYWWENEGQFHRAGGDDYCKTFAWFAFLNREQAKQKEILALQQRISELEQQLQK